MQQYGNMHISWHFVLLLLAIGYNVGFAGTLRLDKYHSHEEMISFLKNTTNNYPNLTSLYSIGNSILGRDLWVMKIAVNSVMGQEKPNVKLVANIHGNEVVGRELAIHFIQYLVSNYNVSSNRSDCKRIVQLLNYANVHILPSINPDGFNTALSKSKPTINTCNKGPGRNNKRDYNLNRNFPDYFRKNTMQVQPETIAIKDWLDKTPFVLSACLHGGSLVASYPFDNTPEDTIGASQASLTPDDDVFKYLAIVYSKTHPTMHKGEPCPHTSLKFQDGISNGAAWYSFTGGMQDYNYMKGCMEVTLEISCCKFPMPSELPQLWNENKEAMLLYLMQVMRGVHGNVTDKEGHPIGGALLRVAGRIVPFYSTPSGQFWRVLLPGDYLLQISASGYANKSVPFTVPGSKNFTEFKSSLLQVKLDRFSTSTPISMKPKTTPKVTKTTEKAYNVTLPSLDEIRHSMDDLNSTDWKIGESKSGVISKYFCSGLGLLSLVVMFLF